MGLRSYKSKQFPKISLANRKFRVVFINCLYGEVDLGQPKSVAPWPGCSVAASLFQAFS